MTLPYSYPSSIKSRSIYDGRVTEYWPNGMVKVTGRYERGQKMHDWLYFNQEGGLIYQIGWMIHNHENAKSFIYYESDYSKHPK